MADKPDKADKTEANEANEAEANEANGVFVTHAAKEACLGDLDIVAGITDPGWMANLK